MPSFVARLRERFGKEPQHRINPDEVVALGAAVQAGLIGKSAALDELVVTDVAPFTLGVETCKEFGGDYRTGYMLPIIHRNTTIPVSRVKRVSTVEPNQTQVRVRVFQGENRRVEHNVLLGEFCVDRVPKGPAGQEVDIRFTYDLNGVLEVEATVVETKRKVTHLITRHTRGMSQAQIAQAVAEMQGMKTPPREEAMYRALLKRAERVFEELPLQAKEYLGSLLDGFEEAMELGDRESIERHRKAVEEFLDGHDLEAEEP
jgi:molecular chaperone HscC